MAWGERWQGNCHSESPDAKFRICNCFGARKCVKAKKITPFVKIFSGLLFSCKKIQIFTLSFGHQLSAPYKPKGFAHQIIKTKYQRRLLLRFFPVWIIAPPNNIF